MKFKIELASSKKKQTTKPKLDNQLGAAVTKSELLRQKWAIDPRELSPERIEEMRKTDGTFAAINNLLTLPILASNWDIESDDDNDPTGEQAQFVRDVFEMPPERGGMTTPFHLVLAEMLRALAEGYRFFEKVYTLSPDGKIVYRKLAGYNANTITIRTDDKGGFDGVDQRVELGDDPIHIPVEKSFLFTSGKERNWLKGESMFMPAAYHYQEKHELYYLGRLQAQSGALPPRVASASEKTTQPVMDTVADNLAGLADLNSAVVLPFGYKMENMGSVSKTEILPLIQHHNLEMTRSVLAQAIMLGSGTSGSWALSKDQTDLLNLVIEGIMKNIEYHVNAYLIPDLTEFNFAKPSYPQFKFAGLTDASIGILENAFTEIIKAKPEKLSDAFIEGVVEKVAIQLGVDIEDAKAPASTTTTEQESPTLSKHEHHHELDRSKRRFLANGARVWRRELTTAEKKVNLDALDQKYDTLEDQLNEQTEELFNELAKQAVEDIRKLVDDDKVDEALAYKIPEEKAEEYRKILRETITEGFNYAKTAAANEIGKESPATSNEYKTAIETQAADYVAQQFSEIEAQIHALVASDANRGQLSRTELSLEDLLIKIMEVVLNYFGVHTKPGNVLAVANSINIGRAATFAAYKEVIDRYEYSAILDEKTCPTCEDLDSSVVSPEDYETTEWQPPIHFFCRCLWIAILKEEQEKPPITGILGTAGTLAPAII